MELRRKKVLVTGAGGFIGSHLTERLVKEGCGVRAFIHYNSRNDWGNLEYLNTDIKEKVEIIGGDITDPFSIGRAVKNCDIVFHLASLIAIPYSYRAPQSYVNTNVSGTLNVMQACSDFGVGKIIHTSTSETYGTAMYTPIDEKHPLQGQSPYSASKIGADKIAESYHLSFDLPVTTIRPFNTYGPRQSARAVIPTIISQILAGKQRVNLGLLSPIRDFSFVADTVEGFVRIAESEKSIGEVVNIGYGKGISIGYLAETIARLMDSKVDIFCNDEVRLRPKKSEVMELVCDNRKAINLIGWEPQYTLEEGLQETINFIQKNMHLYKADIYNI